jgi:hypothetical protein
MLIVPESPKYLYMSKRFTESKDSLRFMAWINGSKLAFDTTFLFDQEYRRMVKKLDFPRLRKAKINEQAEKKTL